MMRSMLAFLPLLVGNDFAMGFQPPSPLLQHRSTTTSNANSALKVVFQEHDMYTHHNDMYCNQCEQTNHGVACTKIGVCGKTSETAACQDTLTEILKGIGLWATAARAAGVAEDELQEANQYTLRATFSTLTNVNFSDERIADYCRQGARIKKRLQQLVRANKGQEPDNDPTQQEGGWIARLIGRKIDCDFEHMSTVELEEFGYLCQIPKQEKAMGDKDAFSLHQAALYGLRGACAYEAHCLQLDAMDSEICKDIHEIWAKLASKEPDTEGLLATVLRVGEVNARIMASLDEAHNNNFGTSEITTVRKTPVKGKAILVSGHDMKDLYELLKQTKGKGVNVYTHGEMLPGHAYPKLKEFDHLVGHWGTGWQNQKFEFSIFPGPVIVTTNCIVDPRKAYKDRLYTMNEVGVDECAGHIGEGRDFSSVIEQALSMEGFPETIEPPLYTTTGFNHRVVLPLADKVLEAVDKGQLSRIFLIGGCDGTEAERNYFTDLAESTPDDSLILTLGCAKNRIIHSEKLSNAKLANGLPRLLDMGQCNDSYSAVVVATELARALKCSVNDLPLSLALSHLEQKAAAVLFTLLHLGVKNIRLGPSLPAYVTPGILEVLQNEYNLMCTGNVEEDLAAMMGGN